MGKYMALALIILPVVVAVFSGCEQYNDTGAEGGFPSAADIDFQNWLNHTADQDSALALGDILILYENEDSDLNLPLWVEPVNASQAAIAGSVRPQFLPNVVVVNMSLVQAEQELERLYEEQGRTADLTLRNLRDCILITGEIVKPGLYELTEGRELQKIIEEAGGFTRQHDPEGITVFRKLEGAVERIPVDYRKKENQTFEIMPGDRITVLRRINYSLN